MSSRTCQGCGRAARKRARTCGDPGCHRADRLARAAERAEVAREAFDPLPHSSAITAQHPGRCPLCPKFIRAGSTIVAHMPTPPLVVHVDDGGNPLPARVRSWSHAGCLDRFEAQHRDHKEDR